jgi:hypothetical protein
VKKPIGVVPMMLSSPVLRFNQRVAIDPCGPLPATARGYRYLVLVVELWTKFPVAYPTKSLTSEEIYRGFLEHYVYIFGCPEELLSDRGANMISELATKMCAEWNINKISTTAEHPQSDPAERHIRTLKTILKKLTIESPGSWDLHVPKALFAMRTQRSNATGFPPFQLMFGRKPSIPEFIRNPFEAENLSLRAEMEIKMSQLVKENLAAKQIVL